jgi:hypothetical protein
VVVAGRRLGFLSAPAPPHDRITGGVSDDLIDGGADIDTAAFSGPRSAYTLATTPYGWSVRSTAEGRDNEAFVDHVYRNVVGVLPTAGERSEYTGLIGSGAFTQASLAELACLVSVNTASVELVGLAAIGIEFNPRAEGRALRSRASINLRAVGLAGHGLVGLLHGVGPWWCDAQPGRVSLLNGSDECRPARPGCASPSGPPALGRRSAAPPDLRRCEEQGRPGPGRPRPSLPYQPPMGWKSAAHRPWAWPPAYCRIAGKVHVHRGRSQLTLSYRRTSS